MTEPSTPLVDGLAVARGLDKAELVMRILAKADYYTAQVGDVVGKRQKLEDEITAATTVAEVEAITW